MSVPKYKPEYCEMLIEHMSVGRSYESFGAVVRCGRRTLYDWEKQHPEWKAAKAAAVEGALYHLENCLVVKRGGSAPGIDVEGKEIDSASVIFPLKTRFHELYGEKQIIEQTVEQKGAFKIVPFEVEDEREGEGAKES